MRLAVIRAFSRDARFNVHPSLGFISFRAIAQGRILQAVNYAENQQQPAPPDIRVQVKQDDSLLWRVRDFIDSAGKNQSAIHE